MRRGVRSKYLLLAVREPRTKMFKGRITAENGEIKPIACGDAKAIIKAACDAPCGVFLIDLEAVPKV